MTVALWVVGAAVAVPPQTDLWATDSVAARMKPLGTSHTVRSRDGTRIGYLSVGDGPAVLVIPGVLSMAADYAAFARALSEHFTVHTIERRGRGESGPQGGQARQPLRTLPRNRRGVLTLAVERLSAVLPHSVTKEFPRLDHFGIERTALPEVAKAVSDYFL